MQSTCQPLPGPDSDVREDAQPTACPTPLLSRTSCPAATPYGALDPLPRSTRSAWSLATRALRSPEASLSTAPVLSKLDMANPETMRTVVLNPNERDIML